MLVKPKVKELLISYGKPRKIITTNVSKYIKGELSYAGLNIGVYKAHISRPLHSGKARDIEIPAQDMTKRSTWKSDSVSKTFYSKMP